jgi:hypothetical protein
MMLVLSRRVAVEAFVALAEIGVPSQREEILAVLKLASELGGQAKPEDVNEKLLGRPAEFPQGNRILTLVESYGLMEKAEARESGPYHLTEAGLDSLRKGEVMIPEEGSYMVFATRDPLFIEPILRIDRAPDVEKEEVNRYLGRKPNGSPRDGQVRSIERPDYLNKYKGGYIFPQAAKSGEQVQVNSISERIAPSLMRLDVEVVLELESGSPPKMKIRASPNGYSPSEVYSETAFDMNYPAVLGAITSGLGQMEAVQGEQTLLIDWGKVNPAEAERFLKQVDVREVELGRFGRFKASRLTLPILPRREKDAVDWGNFLLRSGVTGYLEREAHDRLREEVASRFGKKYDLQSLAKQLDHFDEVLTKAAEEKKEGKVSELYWFLNAPQDLTAGRPSSQDDEE